MKYDIRRKKFHISFERNKTCFILHTYPPMKMQQTGCSETLAYKIQTPVGITQKKAYNFQNKAKVWNQERPVLPC